ncbi:IS200/IS605 family element transposase accessory protein TnpB [Candidatus Dependentiae bacterium]|nr:IS200/IS605 family element transposase accessory protein TnpB [Candidatus Dependentiae bacterium]
MNKAYKFRIYPNKKQQQCLAQQFGCIRFVYNNALFYRKELYAADKRHISKYDLIKRLVLLKTEYPWIKEADSQALQQSVMQSDTAFKNFFNKKAGFPRFKNKHSQQSIAYPQRVKVKDNKIYLPKVGWVSIVLHRLYEGTIKTVYVSKAASGKYYASLVCYTSTEPTIIKELDENKVIGIDLGLHDLMVTSHGLATGNPKFLLKAQINLKRKQQKFSRKTKGSSNQSKARLSVAKAHERAAAARNHFQHTWTKRLVDENQAIIVEDLHVKGMLKNRKLSKAISDASWHSLITKLEYKLSWQGKCFKKVDRFYASTKTCNACGTLQEMPLSQRVYSCSCGWKVSRDTNAALNIKKQGIEKLKAAGYTVSARGGLCKTSSEATAYEARSLLL